MKELLYKMFGHKSLSKEEAKQVLLNISDGRYNDSQLSAFMTVFLMRSITTEELAGFREALSESPDLWCFCQPWRLLPALPPWL
jgi:anthranilate phosphoribosyltransferase